MAASGASPEDIAKALLIQTSLLKKGVSSEVLAQVFNKIVQQNQNKDKLKEEIEGVLKNDSISTDEITKALSMQKYFESGKLRGMKELQKLLEEGKTDTMEGLEECINQIFESGGISPESLSNSLLLQKAISSAGAGCLASAILIQKAMLEGGMAIHDVSNAMSLSMSLIPVDEKAIKELKASLIKCLNQGLVPSDIDIILAFKDAL